MRSYADDDESKPTRMNFKSMPGSQQASNPSVLHSVLHCDDMPCEFIA